MIRLNATERRQKIVKAAIALFSARGFRGTTTAGLARAAGISEALLFRHFPDKKSLYRAMLSACMEDRLPPLLQNLPSGGQPRTVLLKLAHRVVEHNEQDPTFMRLLLFSALEGHALSDLFFQRRTLPVRDFLKNYFRDQMRRGVLRKTDPGLAAQAFLAMIFGTVQTRVLYKIPRALQQPLDKTLESYVKIFLQGMER